MLYLILKALHVIFMVSYFAGLFYLVRLFVYYKDTDSFEPERKKILREQYRFMATRLWNFITVPAFTIMLLSGLSLLLVHYPEFPLLSLEPFSWFYIKAAFLIGLFLYHFWCYKKVKELNVLDGETLQISNLKLRQFNEFATFILFLVVFTAFLKSAVIVYWWQLTLGFSVLVLAITLTVKLVNRAKKNKS